MPLGKDMMELLLPHCRCQVAWPRSWKADVTGHRPDLQSNCDTRPVPIYHCWVPRKKVPNLDKWALFSGINTASWTPIKKEVVTWSQKHTFLLSFSIYSITLTITHIIAHCNSLYWLPPIHNLYCVITNFTIRVHLAGTTPVPPPNP